MMLSTHLLSWLIFLPIVGGIAVLGTGHRATLAKWLSLAVSGVALLLSIPLWTLVQDRHVRDAVRGALAMDFDDSFGVLHRR